MITTDARLLVVLVSADADVVLETALGDRAALVAPLRAEGWHCADCTVYFDRALALEIHAPDPLTMDDISERARLAYNRAATGTALWRMPAAVTDAGFIDRSN